MKGRAPLGLISAAAILGAHWVAYLLAAPDPHERTQLLLSTGHGYWPVAVTLAVAAGVFGLFSFVSHRVGPERHSSRTSIFAYALPRFLVLQVGGFAAMEVAERVASGHSFGASDLLATTFLVGIAIQVLASFLTALFLVLIAFVVERFTTTLTPTCTTPAPRPLVSLVSTPRLVPATGAHTLRGPPLRA